MISSFPSFAHEKFRLAQKAAAKDRHQINEEGGGLVTSSESPPRSEALVKMKVPVRPSTERSPSPLWPVMKPTERDGIDIIRQSCASGNTSRGVVEGFVEAQVEVCGVFEERILGFFE